MGELQPKDADEFFDGIRKLKKTQGTGIKEYSDQELNAEIERRKNIQHQKEVEAHKEEQRIFNLPQNVKARDDAIFDVHYKRTFQNTISRSDAKVEEGTQGIWKICGEDPNAEMVGHHEEPLLGYVEGTLSQAIKHAIKLRGFITWGGCGYLALSKPPEVKKL